MTFMSMNKSVLDKIEIVHRYFDDKSTEEIRSVFGEELTSSFDNPTTGHYCVYINEPQPILLFHLCGGNELLRRTDNFPDLKAVLCQLPQMNFESILFVLSNYSVSGKKDPIGLIQKSSNFQSVPAYDDLLTSTYGYLFYKHQLEQLISRVINNRQIDEVQLRKEWNKKLHRTIAEFDKIEVFNGTSLTDFIKARTIEENNFVWNPNYSGAQKLWNYLLKQSK